MDNVKLCLFLSLTCLHEPWYFYIFFNFKVSLYGVFIVKIWYLYIFVICLNQQIVLAINPLTSHYTYLHIRKLWHVYVLDGEEMRLTVYEELRIEEKMAKYLSEGKSIRCLLLGSSVLSRSQLKRELQTNASVLPEYNNNGKDT